VFEHVVTRPGNVKGGVGAPILPFLLQAAAEGRLTEILLDGAWFNTTTEDFWYPLQEAGVRVIVPPNASMKVLSQWQGNPLYFRWPLCPGTPDEILDLARNLKRPPALCLDPAFTDEELEELAHREEGLDGIDTGIMQLDDDLPAADRPAEDADEYDDKAEPGGNRAEARWWAGIFRRPYDERKLALKLRRQRIYEQTNNYVSDVERIREWALVLKESATAANGWTDRYDCPAKSGLIRCPFYQDSMDIDPIERPTAEPRPGGFCSKTRPADKRDRAVRDREIEAGAPVHVLSLALPRNVRPKLRSRHFIGTRDWIRDVTRRSGIERDFASLKARSGSGLGKGYFGVGGLVQHALLGGIVFAARTYLNVHAWIARGGVTADPVYAPAPEMHGFAELTREQAAEVRLADLDARDQPHQAA
jgi:hypothetical protein